MSRKNSNGIVNSFAVITESFRSVNIDEDGILQLLDCHMFLHLFEDVPDFRDQVKITYKLSSLLMMVFLCVLERGKISYTAIADLIEAKEKKYVQYGLLNQDEFPSHDTIRRILTLLDSEALYENTLQGFYAFLQSLENHLIKAGEYKHIAFDGKEIRGSGRSKDTQKPKRNTAMLNVYDSGLNTVVSCVPIGEKENEIPVSQQILRSMNLKNTVSTADALHCQRETADLINDRKGIYVLTVKDNQPSLSEEIQVRFNNPKSKITTHVCGQRIMEILDLPKNYALSDEWAGLKTFVRMRSVKGKKNTIRYFISNTKDHRLITDAIEARWACETMHKLKDMDLYEDAVRSTDRNALTNIALLNNLAVQLFHMYASISGKEFRKAKVYFQVNPIECLNLILGVMSSEDIIDSLIRDLTKKKRNR